MMELWQAARVLLQGLLAHLDLLGACGKSKPRPDKVQMHFSNFDFSATQILWTLTFAALLVLLVVLLGRDRVKRFPWFTASIAMMGLLELTEQLLLSRLPRITGIEIYWVLSSLNAAISLLVLVELARRSFHGARKLSWFIGTLALLAVGAAALVLWGPWPAWATLMAQSQFATIRLMQFAADKCMLLSGVLTIELGLLVTLLGRRFGAGWRSHAQRIMVGLSTVALAQLALRGTVQAIGKYSQIHTQAEYEKLLGLRDKLINADKVVYLCVLLWWIACLWIDEPAEPGATLDAEPDAETDAETKVEAEGEADPTEAHADEEGEAESRKASEDQPNAEPQP
jgi:hypothetical protein